MKKTSTGPGSTHGHGPISATPLTSQKIRSPHAIPFQSMNSLVQRWSEARGRTFDALHTASEPPDCDDLFAELAYGTRIAQEATAGRWCAVADLLRAGAVESWLQVGVAMGTTETEARDGFHAWIAGQVDLQRRTGTIGITETQAGELYALAEAVTW